MKRLSRGFTTSIAGYWSYVSITGGEPFLYKQIFEVLDYAHDLGYWITILSHGGLLDAARIERLKKYFAR